MLELRPNCELCDRDLPPDSGEARICTYECTYCADCVAHILHNVCPTCGGGFERRPIRPRRSWRPERRLGLAFDPASDTRRHTRFSRDDIAAHVARIRGLRPEER
ncbi:DUF1272 domain-containing protein [Acuticoccus kandeliae]|uniref:DUF1272 domain-containing protein n=1 Tax=Acuticoccus kandeliae TaxID=2073160 RepID=UPI000D3EB0CC|nr:DUF1272 domain-containing protein [Acuticoccus kandeliae]